MTNTYLKTLAITAFAVGLSTLPFQGIASVVTITNASDAELATVIEPGEGKILGSKNEIKSILKAGEKKELEVKRENLGDSNVFSIKGTVTAPSLYNRCTGLLVDRDYSISYVPGKIGVVCYITGDSSQK